jgi:hypothetical protein
MTTLNMLMQQNLELLGGMYRALASLRDEVLPVNPALYAVLAEGSLEQIQRLLCDLEETSGASTARELQADVWLCLQGPTLEWPETPASVLTSFLDALRKGVQTVTECTNPDSFSCNSRGDLARACDFRVVAIQPGDLKIGVRLPDEEEASVDPDAIKTARHALDDYLEVAAWLGTEDDHETLKRLVPDANRRHVLLNALRPLVPQSSGDVDVVEIYGRVLPAGHHICLSPETSLRLDRALNRTSPEHTEQHTGATGRVEV